MAVCYISEYAGTQFQGGNVTSPPQELSSDQTVAIGAGSVQSVAFKATTNLVGITADSVCSIAFGPNPTATATNKRIAANTAPIYFGVQPGWKVAVITNT
jgi:hypothetical protein